MHEQQENALTNVLQRFRLSHLRIFQILVLTTSMSVKMSISLLLL